jgi:hypothetical protein
LGLTNGNASAHLAKLEEAAWWTSPGRSRPLPRTIYTLTRLGRTLPRHWQQLDDLRHAATVLAPNPD